MVSTSAMPAMLCSRRLMVQSASVRNFIGGIVPSRLRTPTSRISPINEETGVNPGTAWAGKDPRTDCNRSCTNWRARKISVPQSNSAKTSDSPTSELERKRSSPPTP